MEELIESVSPNFDWIVIDAPPVLAVTDAVELARAADACIAGCTRGSTPYEVAQRAKAPSALAHSWLCAQQRQGRSGQRIVHL
jgi:Mrp family chromosome partitioning ATPase